MAGWGSNWRSDVSLDRPVATAMCDVSGFQCRHEDLVKQYEWYGNVLQWTNLMVAPDWEDKPCEQNRRPAFDSDLIPVMDPRTNPNLWATQDAPWPVSNPYDYSTTEEN